MTKKIKEWENPQYWRDSFSQDLVFKLSVASWELQGLWFLSKNVSSVFHTCFTLLDEVFLDFPGELPKSISIHYKLLPPNISNVFKLFVLLKCQRITWILITPEDQSL